MEKVYIKIISAVLILCGCSDNPVSPNSEIGAILFVSRRDAKRQIYAMNEDGSNITRITRSNFNNDNPRWSKDGQSIVFNSSRRSSNIHFRAIVMADANGDNERVLLEHGLWPVFSPTGDKIAFSFDTLLPGFGTPYDIVFMIRKRIKRLSSKKIPALVILSGIGLQTADIYWSIRYCYQSIGLSCFFIDFY